MTERNSSFGEGKMVIVPFAGGLNAAMSNLDTERPRQVTCTHGDVWVVDTLSRRVVRRQCRDCEAMAEAERPHGA